MDPAGSAAAESLPQQVKQVRDGLFALLREAAPHAADWVERARRQRPRTPTVVVVGETDRGKSALVNALVGEPGLSPVHAAAATAVHVRFEHAQQWEAHAWSGSGEVWLELSELPDRVLAGDRSGDQLPPRCVRVGAPLSSLENMTIVDTPGVGGLDELHGELALDAAESATALLFTVDSSAPFSRGELEFLQKAAQRVETVVFALTKTDRYRGWRQILAEDQRLLAEHAPRFAGAPFYPVSARLHELAENAPTEQAADVLRTNSGIDRLRADLERLVGGRAAMLGEANTLRALITAAEELEAELAAEERALATGEGEAADLRRRRHELSAARRSSTRGWQLKLRGEVQRARVELGHEVSRQIRGVQNWFRRAIDTADRDQLAGMAPHVDAALQLVSSRISAQLSSRLSQVAEQAFADLFSAEELKVVRAQFARGAQAPIELRQPDRRPPTAEDKLLVFLGVSGGLGLGRAAVLPLAGLGVGALSPIVLPVTIGLGLGAGWWMARVRKHAADKQHLKQWLTEVVSEAKSTLEQVVAEQLIEAEQQLSLALDEALGRRIEAIEAELKQVDKALRMDAAERQRRLQAVQRRLAETASGRRKAEHLLGQIRRLRDSAPPAVPVSSTLPGERG